MSFTWPDPPSASSSSLAGRPPRMDDTHVGVTSPHNAKQGAGSVSAVFKTRKATTLDRAAKSKGKSRAKDGAVAEVREKEGNAGQQVNEQTAHTGVVCGIDTMPIASTRKRKSIAELPLELEGPQVALPHASKRTKVGRVPSNWRLVKPPTLPPHPNLSQPHPSLHPRIWTGTRSELDAVIPALTKHTNGVAWDGLESPVLIFPGYQEADAGLGRWEGDSWDGREIRFSIVRETYVTPSCPSTHIPMAPGSSLVTPRSYPSFTAAIQSSDAADNVSEVFQCRNRVENELPSHILDHSASSPHPSRSLFRQDLPMSRSETVKDMDQDELQYPVSRDPSPPERRASSCPCTRVNYVRGCSECSEMDLISSIPVGFAFSNLRSVDVPRLNFEYDGRFPHFFNGETSGSPGFSPADAMVVDATLAPRTTAHYRTADSLPTSSLSPMLHNPQIPSALEPRSSYSQYLASRRSPAPRMPTKSSTSTPISASIHSTTGASRFPSDSAATTRALVVGDLLPPVPPEVSILQGAQSNGLPLSAIIARDSRLVPWDFPDEVGYFWAGFFRITGSEENILEIETGPETRKLRTTSPLNSMVLVRKTWEFSLRWVPGGEELLRDDENDRYDDWLTRIERPWWEAPASAAVSQVMTSEPPAPDTHSNVFIAPTALAQPVIEVSAASYLLIPLHLLAPFSRLSISNDVFPVGWYCMACGRVNFQAFLRTRICNSTSCCALRAVNRPDDSPVTTDEGESWALDASSVRGPRGTTISNFPNDAYSHPTICNTFGPAQDGMRVFEYLLQSGSAKLVAPPTQPQHDEMPLSGVALPEPALSVRHLFTGNVPQLQQGAERLFTSIQLQMPLERKIGRADFTASFDFSEVAVSENTEDASDAPCERYATSFIERSLQASCADLGIVNVRRMTVRAWVDIAKSRETYRVDGACVALLCLGADTAFTYVEQTPTVRKDASANGKKAAQKAPLTVTMIHGDMLVLRGGQFQFSMARTGMCIMLEVECACA